MDSKIKIKSGIISEHELVELYGSDAQKKSYAEKGKFIGSYKTALFKKLDKYCDIKPIKRKNQSENMYRISEVYEYPLPSNFEKMNKSLYQYIVPLILNKLINGHDENNSIEITVGKWAREIDMINRNYNLVKYNREDTSSETQIQLETINEFYDKADHMIDWYITNALDYLKSAGLIIWREVNQVTIEESDNKSIIDCNGNISVNVNLTTHQASKEEMEYYAQCIAIADEEAKIENASERYYSKKTKLFQEVLKRELYKRRIKYIYKAYEAYYVNLDKCKALLSHFKNIGSDKLIDAFNKEFSDMIIKNAGRRFEKNAMKYLHNSKNEYLLSFESLCEITIDNKTEYLSKRIREKNNDDNYNLQITHKKGLKKNNESE